MSKVYLEQVQKAQMLVEGLKKNYDLIKNHGISREQIAQLEKDAEITAVFNKELDELRAQVSLKASQANKKLTEVKNSILNMKHVVKKNFDQTKWQNFGVYDKR